MFRRFGVEIEGYNVHYNTLRTELIQAGLVVTYHKSSLTAGKKWIVTTDASLTGDHTFELVSPILEGREGLQQLQTVVEILQRLGAKTNERCGLHVHIEAVDFTLKNWKNLFKRVVKFEREFDSFVTEDRRDSNNKYCRSHYERFLNKIRWGLTDDERRAEAINLAISQIDRAETLEDLSEIVSGRDRRRKFNLEAFWRHGTLEVRSHHGVIDPVAVCNWVKFLSYFVENAIASDTVTVAPNHGKDKARRYHNLFFTARGKKDNFELVYLHEYYVKRAKAFGAY